jgi:hypothetical protein
VLLAARKGSGSMSQEQADVVAIVSDSLRQDYVGYYGDGNGL